MNLGDLEKPGNKVEDISECLVHLDGTGVVECMVEGHCEWEVHSSEHKKLCKHPFVNQVANSTSIKED